MKIAGLTVTAYLGQSESLKDKRSVVKSLQAWLKREFGASVCEDDCQNDRKWIGLGIALACADEKTAQQMAQRIERALYEEERFSRLNIVCEIY